MIKDNGIDGDGTNINTQHMVFVEMGNAGRS